MLQKLLVNAQKQDATLFLTSRHRKSYYNQSRLYEKLKIGIFEIKNSLSCHLVTFPYISVVVVARDIQTLDAHKDEVIEFVSKTLWNEREK